jgi:hypothetical protein
MSEPISIREYGRRKNLSDTYIRRMIANGVITAKALTTNPSNGWPMIIPDVADADWSVNYGHTKEDKAPKVDTRAVKPQRAPQAAREPRQAPIADTLPDEPYTPNVAAPGTLPDGRKSKAELDRLKAEVQLQLSALELRERKGQLVDKDRVYRALYGIGQEIKTSILSVPDKVLDNILAAGTRNEAFQLLYAALTDALTQLSEIKEGDLNLTDKR